MNEQNTALVPRSNVSDVSVWDPDKFSHMTRVAQMMAHAGVLPKHLRGTSTNPEVKAKETLANCFLVVSWAARMGLDPWGVAAESYVVYGNLGWQGKLVTAVINSRAGLKRNLEFSFNHPEGRPPKNLDDLEVCVSGHLQGEETPRTINVRLGDVKTDNDVWRTMPYQKLCYTGSIWWARRHTPEITLGVLTDDDLERIAAKEQGWVQPTASRAIAGAADDDKEAEQAVIAKLVKATEPEPVEPETTEPEPKPEPKAEPTPTETASSKVAKQEQPEPKAPEPEPEPTPEQGFDLDRLRVQAQEVSENCELGDKTAFWRKAILATTTKQDCKDVGRLLAEFEDPTSPIRIELTPVYRDHMGELA